MIRKQLTSVGLLACLPSNRWLVAWTKADRASMKKFSPKSMNVDDT